MPGMLGRMKSPDSSGFNLLSHHSLVKILCFFIIFFCTLGLRIYQLVLAYSICCHGIIQSNFLMSFALPICLSCLPFPHLILTTICPGSLTIFLLIVFILSRVNFFVDSFRKHGGWKGPRP